MDGDFDVADGMTAGKVPDGIPGKEQDHFRLAGSFAEVPEGTLLIGREPIFQKVDVVRHSLVLEQTLLVQVSDAVALTPDAADVANLYVIITCPGWLEQDR